LFADFIFTPPKATVSISTIALVRTRAEIEVSRGGNGKHCGFANARLNLKMRRLCTARLANFRPNGLALRVTNRI